MESIIYAIVQTIFILYLAKGATNVLNTKSKTFESFDYKLPFKYSIKYFIKDFFLWPSVK